MRTKSRMRDALTAHETIQAYRERYVTGDNIAERALFEGAFAKPA